MKSSRRGDNGNRGALPEGVIAPLVIPFSESENINERALRSEITYLVDRGVHGLSSGGSTGEGAVLSDSELRRCLEIVMEQKPRGLPVVAGIIRNCTRDAIACARDAKAIGVDALLVTPASYFGSTSEGNAEFFKEIAHAVDLPLVIYNVIASNTISSQDFAKMASSGYVAGIKQVDPVLLAETVSLLEDESALKVYAACDQLLYSCYVSGARGAISALVTIAPELCVQQWDAFLAGDQSTAMSIQRKLVPVVRTYLKRPFPGKIKELLRLQNRFVGLARAPSVMPTEQETREMLSALSSAGLGARPSS